MTIDAKRSPRLKDLLNATSALVVLSFDERFPLYDLSATFRQPGLAWTQPRIVEKVKGKQPQHGREVLSIN